MEQPSSRERASTGPWGLGEAGIAWLTSTFLLTALFQVVLSAGGFSAFTPARPGGHLGRAVAQFGTGQELVDRSLPIAWQLLLLFPQWILLLGIAWVFAGLLSRDRPGWSLRGTWKDVPLGVAAGVLLQVPILTIVVVIMQLIFGEFEPSGRALALVDSAAQSPFTVALLVLTVAVGAPLVEEVFYRGLVQPALIRRTNVPVGIVVSSVIFGAIHFSLVDFIPLSVVGLVFGVLAHRTGRLLPAVVAHVTFNLFTLVALLIAGATS